MLQISPDFGWRGKGQGRNLNKVKGKSAAVQFFNISCKTEVVMHYPPKEMITLKATMNFYYLEASSSWAGGRGRGWRTHKNI